MDMASDSDAGDVIHRSCDPCRKENITFNGVHFCTLCYEFLCNECKVGHKRFKPGEHVFISAREGISTIVVGIKDLVKCEEHVKKIKYLCEDHDVLCCSKCLFIHRSCKVVNSIEEVVAAQGTSSERLDESLAQAEKEGHAVLDRIKQSELAVDMRITEQNQQVDTMCDELLGLVKSLRMKIHTELDQAKLVEHECLRKRQDDSKKCTELISDSLALLSVIKEQGTPLQLFIVSKRAAKILEDFKSHVTEFNSTDYSLDVSVGVNSELSALTDHCLENVKLNVTRILTQKDYQVHMKPLKLEMLKSVRLTKSNTESEEPFYSGLDFLSDYRLVVVDRNNKKCTVLDSSLIRKNTSLSFSNCPLDVVCVNETSAVVIFGGITLVVTAIDSESNITLVTQLRMERQYECICVLNSTALFGCTADKPRTVRSIDLEDQETEKEDDFLININKGFDMKCAYSPDRNTFVLTNKVQNEVYFHNTKVRACRMVSHDSIKEPCGVCSYQDGVLVCSKGNNSVVHLSATGYIRGSYLVNMVSPYSICVSRDGSRLALSNSAFGQKKLQLYKIKRTDD